MPDKTNIVRPAAGIAIGIVIGIVIGVGRHNLAVGIALGVVFGVVFAGAARLRNRDAGQEADRRFGKS